MKRYLYPILLVSAAFIMGRDAATLAFDGDTKHEFRPAGEQQHLLQARATERPTE